VSQKFGQRLPGRDEALSFPEVSKIEDMAREKVNFK
jgi:hypothetical protein